MSPRVRVWRIATPSVARCVACAERISRGDRYLVDDRLPAGCGIFHEKCHPSYAPLRHEWNRTLAREGLKVNAGSPRPRRRPATRRHTRGT